MAQITTSSQLSIAERIQRLHIRISLEKTSGIPATDKTAFLALCQEREQAEETHWKILSTSWVRRDNWSFDDFVDVNLTERH